MRKWGEQITLGEVVDQPVEQAGPVSGSFIYIDIGSIDRDRKLVATPQSVSAENAPSRAKQRLRSGDVLVSMTRPNLNAISLVPESLNGAIGSTGFHVLRSKWVRPKYLYFLVQTQEFVDAMCSVVQGALYPAVRPSDIAAFRFRLPSEGEQTRVVDKLEELLSDLDAGVAELKVAQKKLTQYRQSLLKAAVEGQLTSAWRQQNPRLDESGPQLLERILRERRTRWEKRQLAAFKAQGRLVPTDWREKYVQPAACLTDSSNLPEGWAWTSAEQLCDFITKGTTPPKGSTDDGAPKTIPFLRVTNLTSTGSLNLDDKVFVSQNVHEGFLGRSIVYPGDVLMNIVGPPLGQVSVVPGLFDEWNINQAISIFRAVPGVSSRFLALYLLSPVAQAWFGSKAKTTAGQTNLTLEVCRGLPVALPPLDEQEMLADLVDAELAAVEDQRSSIFVALRQATAQRKNILQAAFSGQLVPQDPNDEPASVLLERIRAERATQGKPAKARQPRVIKEPT